MCWLERTTVDLASPDNQVELRATGQVMLFDGFLKIYQEGRDDEDDEDGTRLPQITEGEAAEKRAITPTQSFTQPPPRYTEATLVKRMEELGIGRPSTYASIVTTIQDREYVRKDQNRLIPEDKGRLVTAFLSNYFRKYVEYDFTADLEEQLDDITAGQRSYKDVLERFWRDFSAAIAETADLRIGEVLEKINDILAPHLYPPREDGSNPRICAVCGSGHLNLKTARSGGAFIGCSNYPDCRYTRPLSAPDGDEGAAALDGKLLGLHDNGAPVTLRNGRFGPYVQLGEATEAAPKPPRASLPKGWDAATLDLARALQLLSLPRPIGPHPADGELVEAGLGRFGPFVKHGKTYANLPDMEEVFTIGMNRAVELLANRFAKARTASLAPLAELGDHPDGGALQVMAGRYGPYVKWGKVFATLPKGVEPEAVTLAMAVDLANDKAAKGGKKPGARPKAAAKPKAVAAKAPAKPKPAAKAAKPRAVRKPAAR